MTVELRDQLSELCAVIDDEQGPITTDFIEARDDEVVIIDRPTPRTLPVRSRWLVAVAAAVAVLVLVGGVALLFSLTGSETPPANSAQAWSRVPGNEAVFDQGWMSSVTAGGPGLVAVGSAGDDSAAVWTSVDGLTWSRVPDDSAVFGVEDVEPVLWSVTAGGPGLVAVGSAEDHVAAVWTSVDGTTWFRVPHDDAVFPPGWMTSVTVGGPGLVAVGGLDPGAAVWTSVDGITWTRVPHDETVFGSGVMNSVTAGGPGLVAVGEDNGNAAVWTSVDGVIWSRVPDDESVFGDPSVLFGGPGELSMSSVTAGGPGLVAVGSDNFDAVVWTSVDGVTWSRVPDDDAVLGGDREQSMSSVIVGGPGLVAVGGDNWDAAVWTSVDGLTWSRVPDDEAALGGAVRQVMNSATVGGSGLVTVGAASPTGYNPDAAVWVTEED
ncbi:MAG: WD40/YVTN/BNR-like repeat-containing protein [Acidimicrobiia bacterium]